ncbi:MAG: FAD-binding oxidoreductase [Pseudomonadota bacterium]
MNQGIAGKQAKPKPGITAPTSLKQLLEIMRPFSQYPTPIRPMGANSTSTQCNSAVGGTVVDMTSLNKITDITERTVTAEAGVTLRELTDFLAERGYEIAGSIDLVNRTVGGAVASGSFGPSHDGETAFIGSQAIAMKVVTAEGKLMEVTEARESLMNMFRISMGALGIVYDVTFKIRPAENFVLKQTKMDITTFSRAATALANQRIGLKFFFLPFKGRIYTELRRAQDVEKPVRELPWRLKDWGETTVLPAICGKLGRIVPIASLRYSLVDGLNDLGQSMFTNTLTECGNNAVQFRNQANGKSEGPPLEYTSWCFPINEIGMLLTAYQTFARDYYRDNKFRCDMPVVGFRLPMDRSALLSPSFDQPMIALRVVSNPHPLWEDFVMDFAEFAQRWGGVPLLNQSRCAEQAYTSGVFGTRLDFFKKMRRQMDPDGRMLNPFLAQYLR